MTCTKPGLRAATATPNQPRRLLLGHRASGTPIWWAGGAEGEVTADEDDDEPDDKAGTGAEPPADDWKPPSKEEWAAAEQARSKANKEAMQRRKWLQEHGIDPRTGKKVADEVDETPVADAGTATGPTPADTKRALKEAADRAAAKTELKYRPALHKLAAKNALEEAGCDPGYRELVLAGLDMSQVDVDDEGNVSGLDEQIAEMKTRYPDVFKTKKARATATPPVKTSGAEQVDGGNKSTKPAKATGDWRSKMLSQAGIDGD